MEGAIFSFGLWCNGNTTDSGPVFLGSNPSSPTSFKHLPLRVDAFLLYMDSIFAPAKATLFLIHRLL